MIYLLIVFAALVFCSVSSVRTLIRYNEMIRESHNHHSYPNPELYDKCAGMSNRIYFLICTCILLAVVFSFFGIK
jgi:hypothetical protein